MASTFVTRLDEAGGRRLYEALGRGAYEFRSVPHAHWSAKGEEAVVTWYRSGKLVVQGRGAEAFAARHLQGAVSAAKATAESEPLRGPTIGGDESGKGDYFGPLTVAAVFVQPEDLAALEEWKVEDSKAASDARMRRTEGVLLEHFPHAVRVIEPEAYNAAYAAAGNLNVLLGRLHAEAINDVVAQLDDESARTRIVVDRFGDPQHVRRHLSEAARQLPFVMPTTGERNPAVAAASWLARAAFLRGMDELEGLAGGGLYRGASDPRITQTARRLLREGGVEWLGRFAKLHFKVTEKARA